MLVLSRHRDESIMIGDDIVITVVDIRGDKVRLGIQALQHVPVHRQEIYDAIKRGDLPFERPPKIENVTCPPCPRSICQSAKTIKSGVHYVCEDCGHSWPIINPGQHEHTVSA